MEHVCHVVPAARYRSRLPSAAERCTCDIPSFAWNAPHVCHHFSVAP